MKDFSLVKISEELKKPKMPSISKCKHVDCQRR